MSKHMPKLGAKVEMPQYVRYKEGAEIFCMSQSKFEREVKKSGAMFRMDKVVLVDLAEFNEYIRSHRVQAEYY